MVKLPTIALRAAWLGRRFTSDTVRVEIEDIETMERTLHTVEIVSQHRDWSQVHLNVLGVVGGQVIPLSHYTSFRVTPSLTTIRRADGSVYQAIVRLTPEQPDHDNIGELADLDKHILAIRDREEDRPERGSLAAQRARRGWAGGL
jgi:hypothetical protein